MIETVLSGFRQPGGTRWNQWAPRRWKEKALGQEGPEGSGKCDKGIKEGRWQESSRRHGDGTHGP